MPNGGKKMEKSHELQLVVESVHQVTMDYSKSQTDMIKAGNYDWTNNFGDFPLHGHGQHKVELHLIRFSKNILNSEAVKCMKKHGFKPVKVEYLLAFGAAYPDKQREFVIVALGSDWFDCMGHRVCPFLHCDTKGKRKLDISLDIEGDYDDEPWWEDSLIEWDSSTRFLAMRK